MGPVGAILAAHFQEAGYKVAVCDHDKVKMNIIRTEGLFLEGVIRKKIIP